MVKKISLFAILAVYSFFYIATSKKGAYDECDFKMYNFFNKDTIRSRAAFLNFNSRDTVYCIVTDTTRLVNWAAVADTLCKVRKDSCNKIGFPILVVTPQRMPTSSWDTRYGQTMVVKVCN